jgi:hypothetical protein
MIIPIVYIALALALGFFVINYRSLFLRLTSYAILVVTLVAIWQSCLGLPRYTEVQVFDIKGKILSYQLDEPNAIYIWVLQKDEVAPVSLQLKWSTETAQKMQDATATKSQMSIEVEGAESKLKFNKRGGGQVRIEVTKNHQDLNIPLFPDKQPIPTQSSVIDNNGVVHPQAPGIPPNSMASPTPSPTVN